MRWVCWERKTADLIDKHFKCYFKVKVDFYTLRIGRRMKQLTFVLCLLTYKGFCAQHDLLAESQHRNRRRRFFIGIDFTSFRDLLMWNPEKIHILPVDANSAAPPTQQDFTLLYEPPSNRNRHSLFIITSCLKFIKSHIPIHGAIIHHL